MEPLTALPGVLFLQVKDGLRKVELEHARGQILFGPLKAGGKVNQKDFCKVSNHSILTMGRRCIQWNCFHPTHIVLQILTRTRW